MNSEIYQSITQQDYESVAGPDWPSYNHFQSGLPIPDFVRNEIKQMLTGPKPFDNQAFCVLPFYSIEIPNKTVCCLLPADTDVDLVQRQMLLGIRPEACSKCWNLEDSGFKSDRQFKNETLNFYFDQDLHSLFEQCQQGKNNTVHYKIDTSNTCNSTCVTCSGYCSSLWGQLEHRNGARTYKNWSLTLDQVSPDINFTHAKSILFRGGEPLLSHTNFKILEKLVDHNNTSCFISFVTNGSIELNQQQKNLLSQFSNVNMCFSIDGVGKVFEYMRYPLKWDQLLKNLDYCRENNNIMISSSFTVTNLNLWYFDEITNWFEQNQIKYIVNPVYYPSHFSPGALPKHVKEKILKKINNPILTKLLSKHSSLDDQNYLNFQKEIAKQDTWKNIRLQDYLPEVHELLN